MTCDVLCLILMQLNRSNDERRHLKESKFTLVPDDNEQEESSAAVSERAIAAIQRAVGE